MPTRDHILGFASLAKQIADSMPAPVRPCPVRLVPVTERVGVVDVDPARAAAPEAPAAAPAALDEGWINHRFGDDCPIPDVDFYEVVWKRRDGSTYVQRRAVRLALRYWKQSEDGEILIAYRVLQKGGAQ